MPSRIGREMRVFRLRGCSANRIPLSVRMVWIRHGVEKTLRELPGGLSVRLPDQLRHGDLACAVNGCEPREPAPGRPKLSDVDGEDPDRVASEAPLLGLATVHVGQPRDAMPLKTSRQRRPREMRDRRPESIGTGVRWQQCVPTEGAGDGLVFFAESGRARRHRPGLAIRDRLPLPPRRDRLRVESRLTARLRGRSLRSLSRRPNGARPSRASFRRPAGRWLVAPP